MRSWNSVLHIQKRGRRSFVKNNPAVNIWNQTLRELCSITCGTFTSQTQKPWFMQIWRCRATGFLLKKSAEESWVLSSCTTTKASKVQIHKQWLSSLLSSLLLKSPSSPKFPGWSTATEPHLFQGKEVLDHWKLCKQNFQKRWQTLKEKCHLVSFLLVTVQCSAKLPTFEFTVVTLAKQTSFKTC